MSTVSAPVNASQALEEVDAVEAVARASFLRAFSAGQGYCADAEYSATTWLVHKTRITRGAAAFHVKWARRAAGHPVVAAGSLSGSWSISRCRT